MWNLSQLELWFAAGSQSLYGDEMLVTVQEHSEEIAHGLSQSSQIPVNIIPKPVMTTADAITKLCAEVNRNDWTCPQN